jgi:hypothetical protein
MIGLAETGTHATTRSHAELLACPRKSDSSPQLYFPHELIRADLDTCCGRRPKMVKNQNWLVWVATRKQKNSGSGDAPAPYLIEQAAGGSSRRPRIVNRQPIC